MPNDAKGPITFTAKLNYRKFGSYTQFAYAGQPKPGQDPTLINKEFNSAEYSFDTANIPANVSGEIKGEVPKLPITVLATATASVPIGDGKTPTVWTNTPNKADRERWNDWGIGLLLQGDLKGAEYAFKKVTEAEPGYVDGWMNVARALIQEGENDAAKPYIEQAIKVDPKLDRIYYFKALIQKTDGDYDGALASLRRTASKYPRDRVVLNQIARILFLQRQYAESIEALKQVSLVDPEDLQMHYTAMLCVSRPRQDGRSRARGKAVPALQGRGIVAVDHRQPAPGQARRKTTSASRSTSTRACRSTRRRRSNRRPSSPARNRRRPRGPPTPAG